MQTYTAEAANTMSLDVIAKATGAAITAGTVNFYLIALNGDNSGKWYRAADETWQAAEASAGASTYKGGALWQLEIAAAAWINGVSYSLYAKETGSLNVVYTEQIVPVSISFLYESGSGGTCPIDLVEMKTHLRVDSSDEDEIIAQMMLAATDWAEEFQSRTYITRTRTMYLDSFPLIITPPFPPLVSVTSIKYIDTGGVEQTLDAAYYRVSTGTGGGPGRITEAYNYYWPSVRSVTDAVTITYTAGYGLAAAVPEDIKAAIKMIVHHLYINRGDMSEIPQSAKSLLWQKRMVNV